MGNPYHARAAGSACEREALVIEARDLIAAGRFDEAEAVVRETDDSLEMLAVLAKLYRECLRTSVVAGCPRPLINAMFARAIDAVRRAYPDRQAAMEAEEYEAARTEDLTVLKRIMERVPSGAPRPVHGGVL